MIDLDITKVRLSIYELAYDIEETIRSNPEFLLENDALKNEVIKAFTDKMKEINDFISISVDDEFLDQNLLLLAVRLLELRKKIKEIKYSNICQENWTIIE